MGQVYWAELEAERRATRLCLERFKEELYDYKPHEKSMVMGYLALVVAQIPLWIQTIIDVGEVNFANWKAEKPRTGDALVKYYDDCMEAAKKSLLAMSDEELDKPFYLKNGDQLLAEDKKGSSISSSINHLVHHRGQLTVYMRMNNISVPSIYGPSADDQSF